MSARVDGESVKPVGLGAVGDSLGPGVADGNSIDGAVAGDGLGGIDGSSVGLGVGFVVGLGGGAVVSGVPVGVGPT